MPRAWAYRAYELDVTKPKVHCLSPIGEGMVIGVSVRAMDCITPVVSSGSDVA
jgi:hypothetical protein